MHKYVGNIKRLIKWLAPRAGKMKRILCSDWLPERARWAHLARSGLPAIFPQICCCCLPPTVSRTEILREEKYSPEAVKCFCDLRSIYGV